MSDQDLRDQPAHLLMIGGQLVLLQQKATRITTVLFVDLDVICPTLGCCKHFAAGTYILESVAAQVYDCMSLKLHPEAFI
jgi:hypothetical protein